MFKKHPKGLMAAALSNMGERFGFYMMMAILLLFLQDKLNLSVIDASIIFSVFYFLIYALAFVGGWIADRTQNYKGTIFVGIIMKIVGHIMIAFPTETPVTNTPLALIFICFGLFVIALGSGLFKGNLQALVGQMYDNKKYSNMRDSGFSLFYVFINIGAVFAPIAAVFMRNWWVERAGFEYESNLPSMCHDFLNNNIAPEALAKFTHLATEMGANIDQLSMFAKDYLNVFNEGYHYAYAITIFANLISLWIYLANKKKFPDPATAAKAKAEIAEDEAHARIAAIDVANVDVANTEEVEVEDESKEMSPEETKQRIWALMAVFAVVIFFWFSFHQNGVTLTMFAKDYTDYSALDFQIDLFGRDFSFEFTPEIFQSFNPFFVIFLTPIVLALFGWLRARGKEPTTAGKIAIGMAISAAAYLVMTVVSLFADLPLYSEVEAAGISSIKVTPWLLISVYFILTISELFISPMGISFVSKVSPPKYQGLMQGGWLAAAAVGNQLLFIAAIIYERAPIWLTWSVLVVACLISMVMMLVMLKWLDRVTK